MNNVVCLEELKKDDFLHVWEIMESSFPVTERRTRAGQEALLEKPCYQLYGYRKKAVIAAFFGVWKFEKFVFVEHFAVAEGERNGGIGAGLLQELVQQQKLPVVLEVELPKEELSRRRIRFYERNGFVLNDYAYMQPPLQEGEKELPLLLMSYPRAVSQEQFAEIRETLYREVYNVSVSSTGQWSEPKTSV